MKYGDSRSSLVVKTCVEICSAKSVAMARLTAMTMMMMKFCVSCLRSVDKTDERSMF